MKNITHFTADFSKEEASLVRVLLFPPYSTWFYHSCRQNACMITSAGTIVTGGDDGVVRLWGIYREEANGEDDKSWKVTKAFELKDHKGAISALCEHPSENWVCSAGKEGSCKIWDFTTGMLVVDIPCMLDGLAGVGSTNGKPPKIECRGCVFSLDGQFLFTIQSPRKGGAYLIR